jgi:hypothetical protein
MLRPEFEPGTTEYKSEEALPTELTCWIMSVGKGYYIRRNCLIYAGGSGYGYERGKLVWDEE